MNVFKSEEFGEVRIITVNNKEYFDAINCAKTLGYINPNDAVIRHCNIEGVIFQEIGVISGKKRNGEDVIQYVNRRFIDEGNLYRLIMKSKIKSALKFEKWVFNEVLPSIRKNGAYINEDIIEQVLSNSTFLNNVIDKLIYEKTKYNNIEKNMININKNLQENQKYIDFSRAIIHSNDGISVGAFAKLLQNNEISIGRNRLYHWFRENGYLISFGNDKNNPKQKYIDSGLFRVNERVIQTKNGDKLKVTPIITGKGQMYFTNIISKNYGGHENEKVLRC